MRRLDRGSDGRRDARPLPKARVSPTSTLRGVDSTDLATLSDFACSTSAVARAMRPREFRALTASGSSGRVVSGQGIDGINPPSNAAAERTPVGTTGDQCVASSAVVGTETTRYDEPRWRSLLALVRRTARARAGRPQSKQGQRRHVFDAEFTLLTCVFDAASAASTVFWGRSSNRIGHSNQVGLANNGIEDVEHLAMLDRSSEAAGPSAPRPGTATGKATVRPRVDEALDLSIDGNRIRWRDRDLPVCDPGFVLGASTWSKMLGHSFFSTDSRRTRGGAPRTIGSLARRFSPVRTWSVAVANDCQATTTSSSLNGNGFFLFRTRGMLRASSALAVWEDGAFTRRAFARQPTGDFSAATVFETARKGVNCRYFSSRSPVCAPVLRHSRAGTFAGLATPGLGVLGEGWRALLAPSVRTLAQPPLLSADHGASVGRPNWPCP
jgi:hypothetical protein